MERGRGSRAREGRTGRWGGGRGLSKAEWGASEPRHTPEDVAPRLLEPSELRGSFHGVLAGLLAAAAARGEVSRARERAAATHAPSARRAARAPRAPARPRARPPARRARRERPSPWRARRRLAAAARPRAARPCARGGHGRHAAQQGARARGGARGRAQRRRARDRGRGDDRAEDRARRLHGRARAPPRPASARIAAWSARASRARSVAATASAAAAGAGSPSRRRGGGGAARVEHLLLELLHDGLGACAPGWGELAGGGGGGEDPGPQLRPRRARVGRARERGGASAASSARLPWLRAVEPALEHRVREAPRVVVDVEKLAVHDLLHRARQRRRRRAAPSAPRSPARRGRASPRARARAPRRPRGGQAGAASAPRRPRARRGNGTTWQRTRRCSSVLHVCQPQLLARAQAGRSENCSNKKYFSPWLVYASDYFSRCTSRRRSRRCRARRGGHAALSSASPPLRPRSALFSAAPRAPEPRRGPARGRPRSRRASADARARAALFVPTTVAGFAARELLAELREDARAADGQLRPPPRALLLALVRALRVVAELQRETAERSRRSSAGRASARRAR